MTSTFSFSRYKHLLRQDLAENKKGYRIYLLATFLASWGVMALSILISVLSYRSALVDEAEWVRERAFTNIQMGYMFDLAVQFMLLSVLTGVAPSMLCSCYNTRMKRMRYLMIPGTQLEKFVSRFTITGVFGVLIPIVAVGTAFLVHSFVTISYGSLTMAYVVDVVRDFFVKMLSSRDVALVIVTALALGALHTAMYVFASAIFRSYAYIKLLVVQYVITMPLYTLLFIPGFEDLIDSISIAGRERLFLWLFNVVQLLAAALLIWLSYVLFKRTEVTGYKLFRR